MSRILANIILILIIAFTVSAVPINTEILNLNITLPEPAENQQEEEITDEVVDETLLALTYQKEDSDYLYNPEAIELKFVGKSSLDSTYVEAFLKDLEIEIYQQNSPDSEMIVKRLSSPDALTLFDHTINGDVLNLSVDISSSALDIASGHYNIRLASDSKHLSEQFSKPVNVSYFDEMTYNSPKAAPDRGNRIMTLYFTDKDKNYLIPVSREIRDNGKLIRTTLNALRDGPAEDSGLNPQSPAPYVPAARFSTSTEKVSLETNSYENSPFTQTEEDTYLMMHALINTMTHIENVSSVKFSVDKKDSEPLNGFDLKKSYPRPIHPEAHLALQVDTNRVYLVPVEVNASSAKDMINYLRFGSESVDGLYMPLVPNVDVVNESMTDGVLQVTLSEEVHAVYPTNQAYGEMMMDSIVASLSTLEGVEEIILLTESASGGQLFGYTLGESFTPARYINME